MSSRLKLSLLVLAVLAIVFAIRYCFRPTREIARPECPDYGTLVVHGVRGGGVRIATVRLAGQTTFIPEFHDCQRLLDSQNFRSFGPLAAMWVSEHLAELADSLAVLNPRSLWARSSGDSGYVVDTSGIQFTITPAEPTKVTALPFAVIHAWNQGYSPLKIQKGWNCLYLHPALTGLGYSARMVEVGDEKNCFDPAKVSMLGGEPLPVRVNPVAGGLEADDVPPVGRWDLDQSRHVHYIGLKCGAYWCEVANQSGFVSSPGYSTTSPTAFAATRNDLRVHTVKGWYDEQYVALPAASGGLTPAPFKAIVVPDAGLDGITLFTPDTWVRVGWAAVDQVSEHYKTKLNIAAGELPPNAEPQGGTDIWLCKGGNCDFGSQHSPVCATSAAQGPWYYRLVARGTADTMYTCARREAHNVRVWGSARWRWIESDEKLWFRCENGCCTTQ
jgi:hypothetical protein